MKNLVMVLVVSGAIAGAAVYAKRAGWLGGAEVLKYMPNDCATARVYFDFRGMVTNSALSDAFKRAYDISSARGGNKDSEKNDRALAVMKKAGLDPLRDIHQIAACVEKDSDEFAIGVGGTFGADVLKTLKQAFDEAKDPGSEWKVEAKDGVPYLYDSKWTRRAFSKERPTIIAMPAPNVLMLVPSPEAIAKAKSPQATVGDWGTGSLVSVSAGAAKLGGEGVWTVTVASRGDNLVLDMNGGLGDAPLDQRQMDQGKAMLAQGIASAGFKPLSDAVLGAKTVIENKKLSVHASVPSKALADAIVALAQNPRMLQGIGP